MVGSGCRFGHRIGSEGSKSRPGKYGLAPTFTVYVYNLAQVSRKTLDVAEAELRAYSSRRASDKVGRLPAFIRGESEIPDCWLEPGREDLVLKIF